MTAHSEFAHAIGADAGKPARQLRLFIPGRDGQGKPLKDQPERARAAAELLARIVGGATLLPTVDAAWYDADSGEISWEQPLIVYTHVDAERLQALLPDLRAFLHRLGRETGQRELAVEYDGCFYSIRSFDQD